MKIFHWKRNVFVLAFANACAAASYTMLVPFLPLYLLELGVEQNQVALYSGAVFSITFLIAAIMAPIWGKIADQHGKKPMAIRACIGLSIAYILGGLVTSPAELFGMRALQGLANGFLPAALAITSMSAPKEKLGYSLGIVQTGQIIGGVLGPLAGGIISSCVGMRASFFLAGSFLFIVTLLVVFAVAEPALPKTAAPQAETQKTDSIWKDLQYAAANRTLLLMLGLSFVISMSNMILQPVICLYIAQLQNSMTNVEFTSGLVFSLGGIAGVLTTAFWGTYGQKHGYFFVMALAFFGAGFFNLLQYLPESILGFAVLQFLFGLFFVGANPAVSAMLVNLTPANFRARVFGLYTTASQSGSMVGPLIGSFISATLGIRDVFLFTGPFMIFLGIAIWFRWVHTKAVHC